MRTLRSERGFTVVELLIAIVLLIAIGVATLAVVAGFSRAVVDRATGRSGSIALGTEIERLRTDAAAAFAVFVPATDIFGHPNAVHGRSGHEVDVYARAADGTGIYSAYRFDAPTQTLQRFDYTLGRSGRVTSIGVLDRRSGVIDPTASYAPISGVTRFAATSLFASELTSATNPFGPLLAGVMPAPGATPAADPVGFVPPGTIPRDDLYGGNTVVALDVAGAGFARTIHLAAAALPSGFTIHAAPAIRAFTYRINTVHRDWLGFGQKTRAHIFEQLQFSFAPQQPGSWHVWCDFEMYGVGQGLLLDDHQGRENYRPLDWTEGTAGAFYVTGHELAGSYDPNAQCAGKIPTPTSSFAPPPPAYPDVIDTPPPCFYAATPCWPYNAPPAWTPPSPWPAQSPPAGWCATHQLSKLCGGPGGSLPPVGDTPPPLPIYSPLPRRTTCPYSDRQRCRRLLIAP